jgi:O-antigen/teichoic acid export membrane protein
MPFRLASVFYVLISTFVFLELKKLASQTAIYGLSSMVGRFLNFLLVPLYTSQFIPEEYGVVTVLYAMVGFVAVLLTFGMETAFFNFSRKDLATDKVYHTAFWSVVGAVLVFLVLGLPGANRVAKLIEYADHPEYIRYFVLILALDALTALPFALLRKQNKAVRFAVIRMVNIFINIGLNLYFIQYGYEQFEAGNLIPGFDPEFGVGYIFIANLVASAVTLLLLLPQFRTGRMKFDRRLFQQMLFYAGPLVIVGFAGMVNELLDRILLKYLLPVETADYDIGVYGAFYKLSIIVTLFVQAFRFAAEPFFFDKASDVNAPKTYARVMHVFVGVCGFIFLATMLFVEDLSGLLIRREEYYEHPDAMNIVPVLLMANVMLGIYYNLSIWYKLSEKTLLGSTVALGGAVGTIVLNVLLIPVWGIMGSALATLAVYAGMTVVAFMMGTKHYPVPYNTIRILMYLGLALLLWQGHVYLSAWLVGFMVQISAIFLLAVYAFVVMGLEKGKG